MLKNYVVIALRNLSKHRGYTFINIVGLAVGMAVCLLIVLFVQGELRYDRFHENVDRMYRITSTLRLGGQEMNLASTMSPLAQALRDDLPEIEAVVRVAKPPGELVVSRGDQTFYEDRFTFADSSFFAFFTFPLISGGPEEVLQRPNAVVISEQMARKYFGEADPLGEVLTVNRTHEVVVTGVMEDAPAHSHLRPDFVAAFGHSLNKAGASGDWGSLSQLYTYVRLPVGYQADGLEAKLPDLLDRHAAGDVDGPLPSSFFTFHVQPITDIRLHSRDLGNEIDPDGGDVRVVYVFASVALLILIVACINFINLATARAGRRSREVGMRKALGARRGQLILQFMGESMVTVLAALLLALGLAELLLPVFNSITGKTLETDYLHNPLLLMAAFGIVLLVGIGAGSYPALVLSSFQPTSMLKGVGGVRGRTLFLRKLLVVVQFGISFFLIVGAVVMSAQMEFFKNEDLGFQSEQLVVVPLRDRALQERIESVKEALARQSGIVAVAASSSTPGKNNGAISTFKTEGTEEQTDLFTYFVDEDVVETLGLELKAGRDFDERFAADTALAYVLTESAVRAMGWEEAVGKPLRESDRQGHVIGVVEDFHFLSLQYEMRPLIMVYEPERLDHLIVRIQPEEAGATLDAIERTLAAFAPGLPFEYSFVDEDFAEQYEETERLSDALRALTLLAVLVAALGLFALAAFSAEQRTKEIGVRKVLGATAPNIVLLLTKDFVMLVLIAVVLASPLAYLAMDAWLAEFAYQIRIGPGVFLLAGGAALLLALATVSFQAVKAARADPVESLRYE